MTNRLLFLGDGVVSYPIFLAFVIVLSGPAIGFAQDHQAHTSAATSNALVNVVREATGRFKDVSAAEREGYGLMFGCVTGGDWGAMGLHYVNLPLVLDGDRPGLVLGSAGSVRLAGAIAQVAWRLLQGEAAAVAIEAPRLHADGTTLHLEGGWPGEDAATLPDSWDVVRWDGLNLFFGGVQAVARRADGMLEAAGDPRRGGAGVVVP